jgi:GTPase SAR1 family protein
VTISSRHLRVETKLNSVGKTSLTRQYIQPPTYVEGYFPTIEQTERKHIMYDGIDYDCEIIDTAGQVSSSPPLTPLTLRSFTPSLILVTSSLSSILTSPPSSSSALHPLPYRPPVADIQDEYTLFSHKYANGVHGYVLVYSINSRQSFDMIQTIYDKILDYSGMGSMPMVIVGQKADLSGERYVPTPLRLFLK